MKKIMQKLLLVSICVYVVSSLGCIGNSSYGDSTQVSNNVPDLKILEHHSETGEFGNFMIVGSAKSNDDFMYAEIRVKFYDADGALLSTSFDNINDLENGDIWKFEVMYLDINDKDIASYKIGVGNCF